MDLGEDLGIFHPDGGKIVDVEEAAVVDLVHGYTPEAQAIRLVFQQAFQAIEAARVSWLAIDLVERCLNSS